MISGCANGQIRLWDARIAESVFSKQVQKTAVTAMDAHMRVPVVACGSHAQYLNVSREFRLLSCRSPTREFVEEHQGPASVVYGLLFGRWIWIALHDPVCCGIMFGGKIIGCCQRFLTGAFLDSLVLSRMLWVRHRRYLSPRFLLLS